jgi:hypothetical protein
LYGEVSILTSRPDYLREATEAWLCEHGLWSDSREIRYKAYATPQDKREQFIPTPTWKAGIVQAAAAFHDRVLFIDNEERNRAAVEALGLPNVVVRASLTDYVYDERPIML